MEVLIPSAKIVNKELQKLGRLPAVVYPVNECIVFDYLFEQYRTVADSIQVICYENADKIHRRLANYKSDLIRITDLPYLGDLGDTIYNGINDIGGEIIINFADTIVLEDLSHLPIDAFYYSTDFVSETWTFFDIENGKINQISDKVDNNTEDYRQKNLFVGVFRFSDAGELKKCLKYSLDHRDATMNSFYQAIMLYSSKIPLTAVKTENWFDIGHVDRYFDSALEVKSREFNHITIDKKRGILRKTSENADKFIGEIKWYLKLPADIEYVRPRIFDYSTSYTDPYVLMEYYAYHTVHELFLYGDLTRKQWIDIFARIAFVCRDFRRYSLSDSAITESLKDMYLNKTIHRLSQLRTDNHFSNFFEKCIRVNGRTYKDLNTVIAVIKDSIPQLLYDVDNFCIIHGDLCFSNIMVDSNFSFIKVIDPRGKFGKFDIYGDPRYEMAKLFHSVDGKYDFIIKDLFRLEYNVDECNIKYEILERTHDFDLFQILVDAFKDEIKGDIKKIEMIEALLFLSMIPLHSESINHQMVMLGTGLEILNRVIDITEEEAG